MAAPRSGGSPSSSSYSHSPSAIPGPSPSTLSRAKTVTATTASGSSIPTPQQLRRASSGASTKLIRRVNTQDRISDILEVCALVQLTFCLLPSHVSASAKSVVGLSQFGNRSLPAHRSHVPSNGCPMTRPWTQPHYSFSLTATLISLSPRCLFVCLLYPARPTNHARPVTDVRMRAHSWAVNAPRVCRRLEARQPSSAGAAAATTTSRSRRSRTRQRRSSRAPPVVVPTRP